MTKQHSKSDEDDLVCARKDSCFSYKDANLFTIPLPRPSVPNGSPDSPVHLSIPIGEEPGYKNYPAYRLWIIKGTIAILSIVQLALLLLLIVGINSHDGVVALAGKRMSVALLGQLNLVLFLFTLIISMFYCLFYRT